MALNCSVFAGNTSYYESAFLEEVLNDNSTTMSVIMPGEGIVGNTTESHKKTTKKRSLRMAGTEVKLGELKHHVFIYKMYRPKKKEYRAFCAGSIISTTKVLTSANCFLTNRKRLKSPLSECIVVAGILDTMIEVGVDDKGLEQWRLIKNIYSQRFFRFPAFNNAILLVNTPFIFNAVVNKIPYASIEPDFDGVCIGAVVKTAVSWEERKSLFAEHLQMMTQKNCELTLLKSCRLFYATAYKTRYMFYNFTYFHRNRIVIFDTAPFHLEMKLNLIYIRIVNKDMEGSGLVCQETGDSEEVDENQGVLVGITSLINIGLPTLHHKVGRFHKWITDSSTAVASELVFFCCWIQLLIKLLLI